MKVLITGGRGFLGTRLAALLKDAYSADVYVLSHHAHAGDGEHIHAGDIRNEKDVSRVFDAVRPEWVFHLAADIRRGEKNNSLFAELFETNVRGTLHVLSASARTGVAALVSAGSFEEYGDAPTPFQESGEVRPISPYAATKAMATLLVSAYGKTTFPAAVLRFPVLYGDGGHDKTFLKQLKASVVSHAEITIPKERVEREFLHVDDAARALVRAAQRIASCRGEIINICTGESIALRDVVRMAEAYGGTRIAVAEGPTRPFEQFSYNGSPGKAKQLLSFEPAISFEDGLRVFLLDTAQE